MKAQTAQVHEIESEIAAVKMGKPMTPAEYAAKKAMTPAPKSGVKGGKVSKKALVEPNSPAWFALSDREKVRQAGTRRLMELQEKQKAERKAQQDAIKKLREELKAERAKVRGGFLPKKQDPSYTFRKAKDGKMLYGMAVPVECVSAVRLYAVQVGFLKVEVKEANYELIGREDVLPAITIELSGTVSGKAKNWLATYARGWHDCYLNSIK